MCNNINIFNLVHLRKNIVSYFWNSFCQSSERQKCVFIDTQSYQTLSHPLPNTGRSKFESTHTQSYQSLSSLPSNCRSKCAFIYTQGYQTLYSLPLAMVVLIVRKQSLYSTNYI